MYVHTAQYASEDEKNILGKAPFFFLFLVEGN